MFSFLCLDIFFLLHLYIYYISSSKGEKPYSCDMCGKSFATSSHYHYHIRSHSGEKPYRCDFCGKMYTASGSLRLHLKSHLSRLAANAFNTINSFPQGPSLPQRLYIKLLKKQYLPHCLCLIRDPLQPDCLAIKLEVDEDAPKRGALGGSFGGILGMGGASVDGKVERRPTMGGGGGGGLPKDGGDGLGKDTEDGQPAPFS